ncbi:MAG: hypothetical protein FJ387_29245 [Verrucomicrobia bacterium]|nr:hypothetical protein [Verrucomicrobiota bacterium]
MSRWARRWGTPGWTCHDDCLAVLHGDKIAGRAAYGEWRDVGQRPWASRLRRGRLGVAANDPLRAAQVLVVNVNVHRRVIRRAEA